jgi:uncharacterized membrane protein YesL
MSPTNNAALFHRSNHGNRMFDTPFYRTLERGSNFLLLNFLWLVACLPLITFFPATVAMFSVVRAWRMHDDHQVFPLFWRSMGWSIRRHFAVAALWLAVGIVVIANYWTIPHMPPLVRLPFYTVNTFVAIVFISTSIFLFPVLAHYQVPSKLSLKLAVVMSLQQLATTGLCFVAVATVVFLTLTVPISLLATASVLAYVVFSLCSRAFPEDSAFPVQT